MATDVFISYSRKNKDFAIQLVEALKASGNSAWIDIDAIPPSAEWWASIKRGIDEANAFVVILTPESLSSPVCTFEMDYAIKNNKRVVPLMRNEAVKSQTITNIAAVEPSGFLAEILGDADLLDMARGNWRVVEKLNWINLRDSDNFDDGLRNLLTVIEQDPKHVQEHTRLLVRAREWEANGRKAAYALRGEDLRDAEIWQAASTGKQPSPTELHTEYITASQQVRKDEQNRARSLTQARFGVVLAIALFAVVGFVFVNLRNGEQTTANATLGAQATSISEGLATSERRADEAQSLLWVQSVKERFAAHDPYMALSLALEANRIDNPPLLSQQTLADVAYHYGIRWRFEEQAFSIGAVAFSPDGHMALSGGAGKSLILRDVNSGRSIRNFEGYVNNVSSLAFSPDGRMVVAGTTDNTLILWDVASGQFIRQFEGHTYSVNSVAFSLDGRTILSGSTDNTLILWDVASGQFIRQFEGHAFPVTSVAFSPDGRTALSGSLDKTMILWNIASKQIIRHFEGHSDGVTSVAFSVDGQMALSGSWDKSLISWNVASGEIIRRFEGNVEGVGSVAFGPDSLTAISGSNNTLILWDVKSGQVIRQFEGHSGSINSVAFSPDGRTAISGSGDHTVIIWDMTDRRIISRFEDTTTNISSVGLSSDGRMAFSDSGETTVTLWDVNKGQVTRHFMGEVGNVKSTVFSPDGRTALSGLRNGTLMLWDVASGQRLRYYSGHPTSVDAVAFSSDGKRAISGSVNNSLILWDVASGQIIRHFEGQTGAVRSVVFSPDGKMVVAGFENNILILWDADNGNLVRRFVGHRGSIRSVVFSPDGQKVLSSSFDATLILWDVASGQIIRRFEGHTSAVQSAVFSSDGQMALSGSWDKSVILWDVASGQIIRRFEGHRDNVRSVAFGSDGRTLLSGSDDGTLIVWRLDTLSELIQWIKSDRLILPLSCEQRRSYNVTPFCDSQNNLPVLTPYLTWTQSPTANPTPTSNVFITTATNTPSITPTVPTWTATVSWTPSLTSTRTVEVNDATLTAEIVLTEEERATFFAANTETRAAALLTATLVTFTPSPTAIARKVAGLGPHPSRIPLTGGEVWIYSGHKGELLTIRVNAYLPANEANENVRSQLGLLDTYFILRQPDGSILQEVDDIQPGVLTDSLLENYRLPVDGTYEIEVRGWNNSTGGKYTLVLESGGVVTSTETLNEPILTPTPT